jgi:lipopolysaccharide transport system ATP-binding protein
MSNPEISLAPIDTDVVISVRNAGKMYRLYDRPQDRLKEQLFWRFGKHYGREFWALQNVSFEVRRGETVGIIGRNGSGKSTLLQIIAGTLAPTTGEVRVAGRVAALLELGSGFNPEFTGRENVFLNGTMLGISHEEMESRYDDIATFADIGEFINQPVKLYSSGMVVRLAFAVASSIEPDLLIVDEALSVGDIYFQAKCMARIDHLKRAGVTILFVSHALQTVRALCDSAILLDKGHMLGYGSVERVSDIYGAMNLSNPDIKSADATSKRLLDAETENSDLNPAYRSRIQPPFSSRITERVGNGKAEYYECCVFENGQEVDTVVHGEECSIVAWLELKASLDVVAEVGILVRNIDGIDLFAINSFFLNVPFMPRKQGIRTRIVFRFPVTLAPGTYTVTLGMRVPQQGEYWDKVFNATVFRVVTKAGTYIPGLFAHPGSIAYSEV